MKPEQRKARVEALHEAADHMDSDWTDDAEEIKQGFAVAEMLRRWADRLERRLPPAERGEREPL